MVENGELQLDLQLEWLIKSIKCYYGNITLEMLTKVAYSLNPRLSLTNLIERESDRLISTVLVMV